MMGHEVPRSPEAPASARRMNWGFGGKRRRGAGYAGGGRGAGREPARWLWGAAGAAGGEDERAMALVGQPAQRRLKRGAVVGQEHAGPLERLGKMSPRDPLNLRAALVRVNAGGRAVAEGDAGNLHCLCFSRRRMPPMLMAWSTALHMS